MSLDDAPLRQDDGALLAFLPDSADLVGETADGDIHVLGQGGARPVLERVKSECAALSDRSVIAVDHSGHQIWIADAALRSAPRAIGRVRGLITALQSYGTSGVLVGTQRGQIQLRDVGDGATIASTQIDGPIERIICDDPDRPVIIIAGDELATWNPASSERRRASCPGVTGARWAPAAEVLVAWGAHLRFWEPHNRTLVESARPIENRYPDHRTASGRQADAIDCRFVDRSALLVMLNADGALRYIDSGDPRLLGEHRLCYEALDFRGASLSSDGRKAVCWWRDYSGENNPSRYGVTVSRLRLDLEPDLPVWKASVEHQLGANLTPEGTTGPLTSARLR